MELIDKSTVVAEIEDKICKYTKRGEESDANHDGCGMYWGGVISCLNEIRSFLDTLEVEEVDCEREIGIYTTKELLKKRNHSTSVFHLTQTDINSIAKHFFELGLKAKEE